MEKVEYYNIILPIEYSNSLFTYSLIDVVGTANLQLSVYGIEFDLQKCTAYKAVTIFNTGYIEFRNSINNPKSIYGFMMFIGY